jgi:sucrose phosphorylase
MDEISFVHLLPFYPYSSDDGFSVIDYREVRKDLGDWDDIRAMGKDFKLVFDSVINHVSSQSHYLKEYLSGNPEYADYFIALPPDTDTSAVLRTRNLPLLHDYDSKEEKKWLWTTFSRDQVDFNFANPKVLLEIMDILLFYAEHGATMIRLDAIPYMWKRLGTSCAHLPETHALIKLFRDIFDVVAPHVILLTETNVPHHENIVYFGNSGDEAQIIYNFSLAPLILWSVFKQDATVLSDWATGVKKVSDRTTFLNITATHDGIGVRPTEGILSPAERMELCELARRHGGDITAKRNSDGSISLYELNINYFDAINDPGADESLELQIKRFMLSQTIPLSFIGIPGIYIHSLLGSRNWTEGVKQTGRERTINRKILQVDDVEKDLGDPGSIRAKVANEYRRLLKIRSGCRAFHPGSPQEVINLNPKLFCLRRWSEDGKEELFAIHNISSAEVICRLPHPGKGSYRDLIGGKTFNTGEIAVPPWTALWLVQ